MITPVYNDSTKDVAFEAKGNEAVTVNPYIVWTSETTTVTITYAGKNATFEITVLDMETLKTTINNAEEVLAAGYQISTDGKDVSSDQMWVTEEMQAAVENALAAAKAEFNSQAEIDTAIDNLTMALENYNPQTGSFEGNDNLTESE